MELAPQGFAKDLTAAELEKMIQRQNKIIQLGEKTGTPGLQKAGRKNLDLIRAANDEIIAVRKPELERRIRISEQLGARPDQSTKQPAAKPVAAPNGKITAREHPNF
jgi:hypothetical protein